MSFAVYNLYHFEVDSNGLNYDTAQLWYANTTFFYSLLMLFVDTCFFLGLGMYLDQVLPS